MVLSLRSVFDVVDGTQVGVDIHPLDGALEVQAIRSVGPDMVPR